MSDKIKPLLKGQNIVIHFFNSLKYACLPSFPAAIFISCSRQQLSSSSKKTYFDASLNKTS